MPFKMRSKLLKLIFLVCSVLFCNYKAAVGKMQTIKYELASFSSSFFHIPFKMKLDLYIFNEMSYFDVQSNNEFTVYDT